VSIVLLDIDHDPRRPQGVLAEADRAKQAISYRNSRFVITAHPDSRKIEVEAL
jgi:hypothetical protein